MEVFHHQNRLHLPTGEAQITIEGSNQRLAPNWSDCGPVYYGGTPNHGSVLANAQALADAYSSQGYNCVCVNTWNNQVYGEFTGNQTCAAVTASVTTECPCLSY